MSSKTVKVTNGKIVNYTITAPGYKTINGSQLITADTTINKNMITEADPNGVYSLGDRIGGIASFVCYFNSINPETSAQQTYAVFVLDAKYRGTSNWVASGSSAAITGLPQYSTYALALESTDPATWTNNYLLQNASSEGVTNNAINFVRNNQIIINGEIYNAQLPNAPELSMIYDNRTQLDALDPTASDYSSNTLTNWASFPSKAARTCTICNAYGAWFLYLDSYGNKNWGYSGQRPTDSTWSGVFQIIPVFEIPVN